MKSLNAPINIGYGVESDPHCLERLGHYVSDLVERGLDERAELELRWTQNWNDYYNKPHVIMSKIVEPAEDIAFPFSKPRADTLANQVIGAVFGIEPAITVRMHPVGGDAPTSTPIENLLESIQNKIRLEETLKSVSAHSFNTNHGIVRVSFDEATCLPSLEIVQEVDFVCVGSKFFNERDSILVGHRFNRVRRDFQHLVESGVYHDYDDDAGPPVADAEGEYGTRSATDAPARDMDDEIIELWEVTFRVDIESFKKEEPQTKESRWYVATLDPESKRIYRMQPYPYSRPMYCTFRYKTNSERGYWTQHSVGYDLQGPHKAYQYFSNMMIYGGLLAAFPQVATKDPNAPGSPAANKFQKIQVGGTVDSLSGTAQYLQNRIDLQAVLLAKQDIERAGDAACQISQASLGQEFSKQMTATEASTVAAGQQVGVGGYVATFTYALVDLGELILELLKSHWDQFSMKNPGLYDDKVTPELLSYPMQLEVTGKDPAVLPENIMNRIMMVLGSEPPLPPGVPGGNLNRARLIKELVTQARLPGDPDEYMAPMQSEVLNGDIGLEPGITGEAIPDPGMAVGEVPFEAGVGGLGIQPGDLQPF